MEDGLVRDREVSQRRKRQRPSCCEQIFRRRRIGSGGKVSLPVPAGGTKYDNKRLWDMEKY